MYTEHFAPNGVGGVRDTERYAVRDARYKLMASDGLEALFDLDATGESVDLLAGALDPAQQDAYDRLAASAATLRGAFP